MGKYITREFGQPIEILKFNDYKCAPCMVSDVGVTADANGLKIVKAGTPWPANDATCKGLLLHDNNVTYGPVAGTYVFEGSINVAKLTANGITVADTAKAVLPRVTFFA
jgi:hypothetical protein